MLSPIGVFSPPVSAADGSAPAGTLAIRFGRWRYNYDDAAHETYGVTWVHTVGSRSRAAVTGAYNYIACAYCPGWVIGGVDFESALARGVISSSIRRPVWASLAVRASAGGGHLRVDTGSVARSIAVEAPMYMRVRWSTNHDLSASLTPGLGYGRMSGAGSSDGGVRPMLGLTTAWNLKGPLAIELGGHRVFVKGGPVELGVSFTWGSQ
jgi:hypothetical protein